MTPAQAKAQLTDELADLRTQIEHMPLSQDIVDRIRTADAVIARHCLLPAGALDYSTRDDRTRTFAYWIAEKRLWEQREFKSDMWLLEGEDFANALRTHCLALQVEVGELLKEVPWKTWAVHQGRPDEAHWKRALIEYVDMMMFMANIAVIMRFSGHDIDAALTEKFAIITGRQRSGSYTGMSEKCSECGR